MRKVDNDIKKNTKNAVYFAGKNLLMAEMIVVILVFSIAAVGCVTLFAESYRDGNYSKILSEAVIKAQNAAECFKATNGDLIKTAELVDDNIILIQDDLLLSEYSKRGLVMLVRTREAENGLTIATITIYQSSETGDVPDIYLDNEIYQLTVAVPTNS